MTVGRASLPKLVRDDTIENSCGVYCIYPIGFTRNSQSFGSSLIGVVCNIDKTSPFVDSISVQCGVLIHFGSLKTSYSLKACRNNVDTGCLHAHTTAVKCVMV